MVFRYKRIYGEYAKDLNRTGFSSSSVIVFTFLFSFQERKWIQRDGVFSKGWLLNIIIRITQRVGVPPPSGFAIPLVREV